MNEDRERQMDMDEVEETSRDEIRREDPKPFEREESHAEGRRAETVAQSRDRTESVDEGLEPLFEAEAAKKFRSRWLSIQSKFVDDPRDSVKQADDLVADIIKDVTMNFANRRIGLEQQWNSGENISTEDMRVTLKRYRSFFERLLTLES